MSKTWRLVLEGAGVLTLIAVTLPIFSGMVMTWLYVPQILHSEPSRVQSITVSPLLLIGLAGLILLIYMMVRTGIRWMLRKGRSH
ncbi:hypothetical protein [Paenibacillus sp. Marseille-Q4541]|uniref:hypothetical protein n=1 Tax=Paenibacillus sp. Marseille-Q4541 TaxID=2831522 RepID=UPI001BA9D228|nr:hypothetical protein [Paenibacillus sp. Marseille-Q4541]